MDSLILVRDHIERMLKIRPDDNGLCKLLDFINKLIENTPT